jgi:hypothetical protein
LLVDVFIVVDDVDNDVDDEVGVIVGINTPWHEFKLDSICIM